MIGPDQRPRLVRRARIRYDRHADRHMVLLPEKGITLNPSAAAILQLCDGTRTLADIIDTLATERADASRDQIERDVIAFLDQLERRGIVSGAIE